MRRILAVGVLAVLGGAVARVCAAPDSRGASLRFEIDKPSFVTVDTARARALLPGLGEGDPAVWFRGVPVDRTEAAVTSDSSRLSFAAVERGIYELRAAGSEPLRYRRRAGQRAAAAGHLIGRSVSAVVDDEQPAVERFVPATRRDVFGSVAAADSSVYENSPHWFLGQIPAHGTINLPLSIPANSIVGNSNASIEITASRTHEGSMRLRLRAGSHDLGEAESKSVLRWTVDAALLEGAERLELTDLSEVAASPDLHDVSDDRGSVWVRRVWIDVPVRPHRGP